MDTYERDDRGPVTQAYRGLEQMLCFVEAMQLVERYGLSLTFDPDEIEWTATDPKGEYAGTGNTPAGAVFGWDAHRAMHARPKGDPEPRLRLVKRSGT